MQYASSDTDLLHLPMVEFVRRSPPLWLRLFFCREPSEMVAFPKKPYQALPWDRYAFHYGYLRHFQWISNGLRQLWVAYSISNLINPLRKRSRSRKMPKDQFRPRKGSWNHLIIRGIPPIPLSRLDFTLNHIIFPHIPAISPCIPAQTQVIFRLFS